MTAARSHWFSAKYCIVYQGWPRGKGQDAPLSAINIHKIPRRIEEYTYLSLFSKKTWKSLRILMHLNYSPKNRQHSHHSSREQDPPLEGTGDKNDMYLKGISG